MCTEEILDADIVGNRYPSLRYRKKFESFFGIKHWIIPFSVLIFNLITHKSEIYKFIHYSGTGRSSGHWSSVPVSVETDTGLKVTKI